MSRSLLIKVGVSAGLAVAAVVIIIYTASQSSGMFRFVHEVKAQSKQLKDRELWMAGNLEPGTHKTRVVGRREQHSFEMSHRGERIHVQYTGAFPRNAQPGRQLVVRGKLNGQGQFQAAEIRTKCPSKYKSEYDARK
jgi:cytochrome c-type biogenesis protein CcmE